VQIPLLEGTHLHVRMQDCLQACMLRHHAHAHMKPEGCKAMMRSSRAVALYALTLDELTSTGVSLTGTATRNVSGSFASKSICPHSATDAMLARITCIKAAQA